MDSVAIMLQKTNIKFENNLRILQHVLEFSKKTLTKNFNQEKL